MIASLSGVVSSKNLVQVIIEVSGVGYGVYVTQEDYDQLELGAESKLYIYEHVREQAHDLFGFKQTTSQSLFEKLLEVSGVGPKMALSVMSIGPAQAVKEAIASGDVAYIQRAGGVGRRVAERIVVDLKDKVGLIGSDLGGLLQPRSGKTDEAVEALVSLGYNTTDAAKALSDVDSKLSTEDRVKQALQQGLK